MLLFNPGQQTIGCSVRFGVQGNLGCYQGEGITVLKKCMSLSQQTQKIPHYWYSLCVRFRANQGGKNHFVEWEIEYATKLC